MSATVKNRNCITCTYRKGAVRRGKDCRCDYPMRKPEDSPVVDKRTYNDIHIGIDSSGELFPYQEMADVKISPIIDCLCYAEKLERKSDMSAATQT